MEEAKKKVYVEYKFMEDFRAARKMFSEGVVYLIIYLLLIIIIIYSSIICLFIYHYYYIIYLLFIFDNLSNQR